MQKMKYSGVEWIGEIPEDWDIKRLKAVLCERNESNNPIKTDYILSLTNDRGVIPYDEKGDVGNKSKEDLSGYKLAYLNDIVLNSMNVIIGSVALSKYYGCVSPVYYMLYPRNPMDDVRYYNYIFQTKEFQSKLKGYGNGIMEIRMRIQMSKLNTVELPIPDATTQTRIADFLDDKCGKIDRYIEKQQQIIDKLKEYKQAVITEAVTKGLDPDAPMKDSGIEWIGMIPEHWENRKVISILAMRVVDGSHESPELFDEGIPYISATAIVNGKIDFSQKRGFISPEYCDICDQRYVPQLDDILMIKLGASTGQVAMVETTDRFNIWVPLAAIRCNESACPKFVYYAFQSDYFIKQMQLSWTYGTQQTLGVKTIERLRILMPLVEEQKQIADYLTERRKLIDTSIEKYQQIVDKLTEYKKSLIYEAVTGKLEV